MNGYMGLNGVLKMNPPESIISRSVTHEGASRCPAAA